MNEGKLGIAASERLDLLLHPYNQPLRVASWRNMAARHLKRWQRLAFSSMGRCQQLVLLSHPA